MWNDHHQKPQGSPYNQINKIFCFYLISNDADAKLGLSLDSELIWWPWKWRRLARGIIGIKINSLGERGSRSTCRFLPLLSVLPPSHGLCGCLAAGCMWFYLQAFSRISGVSSPPFLSAVGEALSLATVTNRSFPSPVLVIIWEAVLLDLSGSFE